MTGKAQDHRRYEKKQTGFGCQKQPHEVQGEADETDQAHEALRAPHKDKIKYGGKCR